MKDRIVLVAVSFLIGTVVGVVGMYKGCQVDPVVKEVQVTIQKPADTLTLKVKETKVITMPGQTDTVTATQILRQIDTVFIKEGVKDLVVKADTVTSKRDTFNVEYAYRQQRFSLSIHYAPLDTTVKVKQSSRINLRYILAADVDADRKYFAGAGVTLNLWNLDLYGLVGFDGGANVHVGGRFQIQ